MNEKIRFFVFISLSAVIGTTTFSSLDTHADWEAVGFAGSYWGADDPCNLIGLGNWEEAMQGFEDGMLDIGYTEAETRTWVARDVEAKDFADSSMVTWGADNVDLEGTDWADVLFFRGHGSHTCSSTYGYYSSFSMDNSTNTCTVNTKNHVRWAEGGANEELNQFVAFACQSGQYCVWENDGYHLANPNSGTYFAVWNAFHGNGAAKTNDGDRYYNYITTAWANGIGEDFVDMFTEIKTGADNDLCAVSIIFGIDEAKQDHIFTWGGFRDHDDPESTADSGFYSVPCDPASGPAL